MVLKLTRDMRVKVVTGHSQICNGKQPHSSFGPISDLGFSPDGQLIVAEKKPGRIRKINRHGGLEEIFGILKNGSSQRFPLPGNCSASSSSDCSVISAMAISPDNGVYVADNSKLHIVALRQELPEPNADTGEVRVADPVANELYTFNRYGQHVFTHSLETQKLIYSFSYSKNTVFGRVNQISDASGNKVTLNRDYSNIVQSIENTLGQKFELRLSRNKFLQSFQMDEVNKVSLGYQEGKSGLLTSKSFSNGDFYIYDYDRFGRLEAFVAPSGESYQIKAGILECQHFVKTDPAHCVTVTKDGGPLQVKSLEVHQSGRVLFTSGSGKKVFPSWSCLHFACWSHSLRFWSAKFQAFLTRSFRRNFAARIPILQQRRSLNLAASEAVVCIRNDLARLWLGQPRVFRSKK